MEVSAHFAKAGGRDRGFNPSVLAEDTELTYRLYTRGWKMIYANSAECYEEAPEDWRVGRQAGGPAATNVMFRYFFRLFFNKHMNVRERLDGILLLLVYGCLPLALGLDRFRVSLLYR